MFGGFAAGALAVVACVAVIAMFGNEQRRKTGETFRGVYIVGPGNDVTFHDNPAQFYAIDADIRAREKLRLREYKCSVEAVGGRNRYDASRTEQTCELRTLAP